MTINEYLARPGALSREKLCEGLGISNGRLSQLREAEGWPPELALKLEQITHGAFCASDLSPVIANARAA